MTGLPPGSEGFQEGASLRGTQEAFEAAWAELEGILEVARIALVYEGRDPQTGEIATGFWTFGNSRLTAKRLHEVANTIEERSLGEPPLPNRLPGLGPADPDPDGPGVS